MHRARAFAFVGAVLVVALTACAGETANTPPSAANNAEAELIAKRTAAIDSACTARIEELKLGPPKLIAPFATGQEVHQGQMERPHLVEGSEAPSFSVEAMSSNRGGTFLVARCTVHKEGNVTDCKMICPNPLFDNAVFENLYARRYKPAMFRGEVVDVPYTFKFRIVNQSKR